MLHVAHLTGLRNTLAAALTLGALVALAQSKERPPLAVPALAWLGVGFLSSIWSLAAVTTLKHVLYDIALPFGGFYAAYLLCRRRAAFDLLTVGVGAGILVLFGVTALAFATGQSRSLLIHEPDGVAYYFQGPNAASTLALFALPFAVLAASRGSPWLRILSVVWLIATPVVGLGTQSRMFWIALVAGLGAFAFWQWDRFSHRKRWLLLAALAGGAIVAIATALYLTEKRATYPLTEDIRYEAWQAWASIAADKPVFGYGFGKRIVREAATARLPQSVVGRDPYLVAHAHNLFLNIVLQVGITGLLVFVLLHVHVLRIAWRAQDDEGRLYGAALVTLVACMLVKNTTDDVMDQSVIMAFWIYSGMLVGRIASANVKAADSHAEIDTNASRRR